MSVFIVFRAEIKEGREEEYRKISAEVLNEARGEQGLVSLERAKSVLKERTYVSISEWENEEAIERWVHHPRHQQAMKRGKEELFASYSVKRLVALPGTRQDVLSKGKEVEDKF